MEASTHWRPGPPPKPPGPAAFPRHDPPAAPSYSSSHALSRPRLSAEPPAIDTRQEPQAIDGLPARLTGTTVEAASEKPCTTRARVSPARATPSLLSSARAPAAASSCGCRPTETSNGGDRRVPQEPLAARGPRLRDDRRGRACVDRHERQGRDHVPRASRSSTTLFDGRSPCSSLRHPGRAAAGRGAARWAVAATSSTASTEPDRRVGGELQGRTHVPREPVHAARRRTGQLRAPVGVPAGDEGLLTWRPREPRAGCGGYVTITPRPDRAAATRCSSPPSAAGQPAVQHRGRARGVRRPRARDFMRNDSHVAGELGADRIDVVDLTASTSSGARRWTSGSAPLVCSTCCCSTTAASRSSARARATAPSRSRVALRGRYFAAVRARRGASGRYPLSRLSRSRARASASTACAARDRAPARPVRLRVDVKPLVRAVR